MLGGKSRRLRLVLLTGLMLGIGGGYAWTFTPSYTLYCLKYALETHDYETFSRYVDLDSVLDHVLDELGETESEETEKPRLKGFLGKLAGKGLFKFLTGEAREVTKAGLSIAVEQAVKDRDRPLPQIPLWAVPASLWLERAEGELVVFPVQLKKEQIVEIKMRRTSPEPWRVVAVTNLKAFLPALQRKLAKPEKDQPENP